MDIIVFGTGKAGDDALPCIESNHHVLFFVDNDSRKWGRMFQGYDIKSPDNIKDYNCDIIITSTKYCLDIAEQLKNMAVNPDKIYACRMRSIDGAIQCETYPLVMNNLKSAEKKLIDYDLFHFKEQKNDSKKVLVFCSFFSVYAKQLIENMEKVFEKIEFSLITNTEEYREKIFSEQLKHIYYFQTMADLKAILEQLPVYDVMQLLWIEREWAYFGNLIRKKTKRLNLNVGGSDFYRATMAERDYKKNLIAAADTVTAETKETIQEFRKYYSQDLKCEMGFLPFGIETLKYIKENECVSKNVIKEKFHIPYNKIVITCGYNAKEAHQHIKLIEALNSLDESIKEQIICVFPMTYPKGCDNYIRCVREKLEKSELDYVIHREFMGFGEMAQYALISDVMIQVQTTDQLSSTMLEEMYAGSIIITGKWLPYHSLREKGIFFFDVNEISEISGQLERVVMNIEKYKKECKKNKEIIWKQSSWEKLAKKWHDIWCNK